MKIWYTSYFIGIQNTEFASDNVKNILFILKDHEICQCVILSKNCSLIFK